MAENKDGTRLKIKSSESQTTDFSDYFAKKFEAAAGQGNNPLIPKTESVDHAPKSAPMVQPGSDQDRLRDNSHQSLNPNAERSESNLSKKNGPESPARPSQGLDTSGDNPDNNPFLPSNQNDPNSPDNPDNNPSSGQRSVSSGVSETGETQNTSTDSTESSRSSNQSNQAKANPSSDFSSGFKAGMDAGRGETSSTTETSGVKKEQQNGTTSDRKKESSTSNAGSNNNQPNKNVTPKGKKTNEQSKKGTPQKKGTNPTSKSVGGQKKSTVSNFVKNKLSPKGGSVKGEQKSIREIVIELLTTKLHLLVPALVLIFVLFLILMIASMGGSAAAANEADSELAMGETTYLEDNFTGVSVTFTDSAGNELITVSLEDALLGMANQYVSEALNNDDKWFESETEQIESLKAFIVIAKAALLSTGNYDSSTQKIAVIASSDNIKFCSKNGCAIHYAVSIYEGKFDFYPSDGSGGYVGLPSGGENIEKDPIKADVVSLFDKAYSEVEFEILAKEGKTDFSTISSSEYSGVDLLDDDIIYKLNVPAHVSGNATYKDMIADIPSLSGYEVVDAKQYITEYIGLPCTNGDWWWPIGSNESECSKANGKTICEGDPISTSIYLKYGYTYSNGGFHNGIDLALPAGTVIIAANSGTVEKAFDGYADGQCNSQCGGPGDCCGKASFNNGYGNGVFIRSEDGKFLTKYYHMQKGSVTKFGLKVGDKVRQGQVLGYIGNSGNSSGNHLHISIMENGAQGDQYVDPLYYLNPNSPRAGDCKEVSTVSGSGDMQTFCKTMKKVYGEKALIALMINTDAESTFSSTRVQESYLSSLGKFGSDSAYTKGVDNKTYTKFETDSVGYGLAQWTYVSRKKALLSTAKSKKVSIGDFNMQVNFLNEEIKTHTISFENNNHSTEMSAAGISPGKNLLTYFNSGATAEQMSIAYCGSFENPGGSCTARTQNRIEKYTSYVKNGCN